MENAPVLFESQNKTPQEMRASILKLEAVMMGMKEHQIEFPITHHFAPGIYMREMFIPKGACLTGKIHRTEHLNILSQGDLSVMTENGMKRLKASRVIKSHPGMKRAGYAHEDSIWITVHHNLDNETNPEKLEKRLVASTFDEAYLTSQRTFKDAILYLGFSPEKVSAISENPLDQVPFTPGTDVVEIRDSQIHRKGVFTTKPFKQGDMIIEARLGDKRTPAGRYCNHSGHPNVEMKPGKNGDLVLIALKDISSGEELVNDYYLTQYTKKGGRLCPLLPLE